jgi:hypothetical protein
MVTDAQAIMAERGFVVSRRNLGASPAELTLIDASKLLDERERWTRLFKETFARAR